MFTSASNCLKGEKDVNLLWVRESGLCLQLSGKKDLKMLWVWKAGLCLQLSIQRKPQHHLWGWTSPGRTPRVKRRQSKLYFGRWGGGGGWWLKSIASTISCAWSGSDASRRVGHPAPASSQLPSNRLSDWQVWPAGECRRLSPDGKQCFVPGPLRFQCLLSTASDYSSSGGCWSVNQYHITSWACCSWTTSSCVQFLPARSRVKEHHPSCESLSDDRRCVIHWSSDQQEALHKDAQSRELCPPIISKEHNAWGVRDLLHPLLGNVKRGFDYRISNIKVSFNVSPQLLPEMFPDICLHYWGGFSRYIIRYKTFVFCLMSGGNFVNITGLKTFSDIDCAQECLSSLVPNLQLTFSKTRIDTMSCYSRLHPMVFTNLLKNVNTLQTFSIKMYHRMSCKINIKLQKALLCSPNLSANIFKNGGACFFGAKNKNDMDIFISKLFNVTMVDNHFELIGTWVYQMFSFYQYHPYLLQMFSVYVHVPTLLS